MNENICYKCRKSGHFARECIESTNLSYVNNNFKPINRTSISTQSMRCFKCNRNGHYARDCRESMERCYRCNQIGHLAKDCGNSEIESGKKA
jgi:cellular nucleic acid-binding protein